MLLTPLLGVLLVLTGPVPSANGDPRGSAVPGPSAAYDTGSGLTALTAGPVVPLVERAEAEQHRTPPGPGDHPGIGAADGVQLVVPSGPASPGRTAARPPSAPSTASSARAPPVS